VLNPGRLMALRPCAGQRINWRAAAAGEPAGGLEGSAGVRCEEKGDGRVRSVRALLWEGRVVRAEARSRYT